MASSQFWQELARQFELIPDQGMLRADGQYTVGSGGPWSWHLAWRGSEFVRNTFETLQKHDPSRARRLTDFFFGL